MKYPLSVIAIALLFSSCVNTPVPAPIAPVPIVPSKILGLMELGFENLATGFGSSAKWLQSANLSSQALTTQPSTGANLGGGGIQFSSTAISKSAFSFGGFTYYSATFGVRNASANGTPYAANLQNLTFLAVDTSPVTSINITKTANGTAFTQLLDTTGADASSLATTIRPTHGMRLDLGNNIVKVAAGQEDFQGFRDSEVSSITGGITPSDLNPLGYGFVARCTTRSVLCPNPRTFAAPSSNTDFLGRVTFAVKVPDPVGTQRPLKSFKIIFAAVTDSNTSITESLEEQGGAADVLVTQRVLIVPISGFTATLKTLPGSSFTSSIQDNGNGRAVRFQATAASGNYLTQGASSIAVTSSADSGAGSLREALNVVANSGTITLDGIAGQTITLLSPLTITRNITVEQGAGTAVKLSGNNAVQVLNISSTATVRLRGFTVQNGFALEGGCVSNAGKLTLEGMTFNACTAQGGLPIDARGGAVFNAVGATLSVTGTSLFSSNRVVGGEGTSGDEGFESCLPVGFIACETKPSSPGKQGGTAQGGAIFNAGTLTLTFGVSLTGNSAIGGAGGRGGNACRNNCRAAASIGATGGLAQGGGLYNSGTWIAQTGSSFVGNSALGGSGGRGGNGNTSLNLLAKTGGVGGEAQGGAVYASLGNLSIPSQFNSNTVMGGMGGNAGGSHPVSLAAIGGSIGGAAQGGAIFIPAGSSLRCSSFGTSANANTATTGASGADSSGVAGALGTSSNSDVGVGSFDSSLAGC